MTDETQTQNETRRYDRKQSVIFTLVLLVGLIGAVYWLFYQTIPDQLQPTPVATAISPVELPPTPTTRPTILPTETNSPLPINTVIIPATSTPLPTETPFPTATESPVSTPPLNTSTPEQTQCSGVRGGKFYLIKSGDSLWSIFLAEYCDVTLWPVILPVILEMNPWIKNPNLIHPTGESGHNLWLPFWETE